MSTKKSDAEKKTMEEEREAAKEASLAELIETRRFLGRELLAWIWFESEVFEGRFDVEGFGDCELWLEKKLSLESPPDLEKEKSVLTGLAPSGSKEAREALRQGKLPTQARIVVRRDEQDFALVLDADGLALSGVKIPALLKGEGEDPFYERMQLVEEIEGAIEALYRAFLELRLSSRWSREVLPAMRAWMHEREDDALARYRELRGRRGVSAIAVKAGSVSEVKASEVKASEVKAGEVKAGAGSRRASKKPAA